jgi:hypothetical protein
MAIQIGKYKRPGIFVEEFDASVITSPAITGGLVSLVMGFSKKGPVNTPVLLQNVRDLENIFGTLDRNLERKGSFFHRTISKLLESSPVYAINLMLTSDTLDQIEYQSVSTRSDASNDVKRLGPYRRFFNTTGFWKRDTETFNNLVKDDPGASGRLLAFTNLSDRYVTMFIFKAANTFGFDRSLLEAYGTAEKVPLYLNPLDYASDYLVDVLIVTGDWTNYGELAVDTKWAQYFTPEGLRKNKVRDFANDRNITLLNFYEGISLIPYFKDANGRNIFIENVINDDTDSTGVFCTFDVDKFEGDFPNGMVDIIGNNLVVNNSLVDTEQETIKFLSYEETIAETNVLSHTQLDAAGGTIGQQVIAFGPTISTFNGAAWGGLGSPNRTALLREGFINGVSYTPGISDFGSTSSFTIGFTTIAPSSKDGSPSTWGPYCVIGGEQKFINSGSASTFTYSIPRTNYETVTGTAGHISVAYVDASTGNIAVKNSTAGSPNTQPQIGINDLVLGYLSFTVSNGYLVANQYSWTSVGIFGTSGDPKEFTLGTYSTNDYTITTTGLPAGSFKLEFNETSQANLNGGSLGNYDRHRKIDIFNKILSILDSSDSEQSTMIVNYATGEKYSGENITISSVVNTTSSNKSLVINLGTSSVPQDILAGNFTLYKKDNEFTLGEYGAQGGVAEGFGNTGSIGKYSDTYLAYQNGQINTGDWFYQNACTLPVTKITFTRESGYDIIVFSPNTNNIFGGVSAEKTFRIPSSIYNSGIFEISGSTTSTMITDPITGTYFVSGEAFTINSDLVTPETLYDVSRIEDTSEKVYLDMQFSPSGDMDLRFTDYTLDSPNDIRITNDGLDNKDGRLRVRSDKSNYKQTIEIEVPAGYTPVANKILINAARYTELKVGDYLQAAVDETILENGQMPKKLARIQRKRAYAPDPTLVEISCDVSINKVSRRGDLQTLRYVPITDFASTYKGISMKGFRVREDSMPDGTEERQNAILNLVAQGTSLYGALVNKEAFDFRYLVDSFGLGLTERSKQQLVDICGERLDAMGILNMPSNKMFRDSTAVTFTDDEGVVQTSFIAQGGDPESNPAFLYSFGDGKGASCVGYFYPYVTVNDNGRPVNVPPAAYVATTYLRKQNSALTTITPWTIAAGVTNGRVTNIAGVEVNFSPTDIENLNGAQINPIVFKRNRGFVIETENTGQTLYKSALSYLHVREVLIELERELSAMLLEFQWRFNTADVRAEIKLRADSICEKYVNRNGLYNYFNKCDEENNTPEIIDNQIGVLDTYVEPIKGMGIIVNNITILRTGAIQAGGFIQS